MEINKDVVNEYEHLTGMKRDKGEKKFDEVYKRTTFRIHNDYMLLLEYFIEKEADARGRKKGIKTEYINTIIRDLLNEITTPYINDAEALDDLKEDYRPHTFYVHRMLLNEFQEVIRTTGKERGMKARFMEDALTDFLNKKADLHLVDLTETLERLNEEKQKDTP